MCKLFLFVFKYIELLVSILNMFRNVFGVFGVQTLILALNLTEKGQGCRFYICFETYLAFLVCKCVDFSNEFK